jgi:two-component system NtrC family sensor kinase
MKDKNLAHMGSLLGGVVHNLNTPLMWVMGRAQLLQSRNENFETLKNLSEEELAVTKQKNDKDITSILEGADKIDFILKGLGYKIQMVNEGYTSVELREYMEMEVNFLMADMRFKHDTKRDIAYGPRSYYAKVDYNALSGAVSGIINTMMDYTEKGRSIKISLDSGIIHISCAELKMDDKVRKEIDDACSDLSPVADVLVDGASGLKVTIALKDI